MSLLPSCQISVLKKESVILSNDAFTASKINKVILVHIIKWISVVYKSGVEMVSGIQTAVLAKVAEKTQSQAVWDSALEKHL